MKNQSNVIGGLALGLCLFLSGAAWWNARHEALAHDRVLKEVGACMNRLSSQSAGFAQRFGAFSRALEGLRLEIRQLLEKQWVSPLPDPALLQTAIPGRCGN